MKTHKVRPILIPTNKEVHTIYMIDNLEYHIDKKLSLNAIEQQLILVSLEDKKIEIGDKFYCSDNTNYAHILTCSGYTNDTHLQAKSNNKYGYGDWNICYSKKVIATQEQLSTELIEQLVDEYNNNGMKDFKI